MTHYNIDLDVVLLTLAFTPLLVHFITVTNMTMIANVTINREPRTALTTMMRAPQFKCAVFGMIFE
jgi:hypothetical protein